MKSKEIKIVVANEILKSFFFLKKIEILKFKVGFSPFKFFLKNICLLKVNFI